MTKDSELFSYDELDIGQFFLELVDGKPYHYGLKISQRRFFDLDHNCLCWLYDTHKDPDEKCFIKCDYEVW